MDIELVKMDEKENSFSIIEGFVMGYVNPEKSGIVEIDEGFSFSRMFGRGNLSVDSLDNGTYFYLYLENDFYGRFTRAIEHNPTYVTPENDVICLIKIK